MICVDVLLCLSAVAAECRFNRAADLLNDVLSGTYEDVPAAMASIFVWLRFSATRHLTWQRNYNTQPRILSAAQARCVDAITKAHGTTRGEAQEWVCPSPHRAPCIPAS